MEAISEEEERGVAGNDDMLPSLHLMLTVMTTMATRCTIGEKLGADADADTICGCSGGVAAASPLVMLVIQHRLSHSSFRL